MIKDAIKKLSERRDLDSRQMTEVFEEIMGGKAAKEDMKEFLLLLKSKGENAEEIAAAAEIMREKCTKVNVSTVGLIDTCGTGGAKVNDINISTLVALVVAACGIKVAKHGNRSFTGKCGSADILEALGVNINTSAEKVAELIEKVGFGFIFAKNFHPAMRNIMEVRRELKTRTIFNILGPLSNPAGAKMQILGVFDRKLTELMAEALRRLGSERAFVVHGLEGLDEISIKGVTKVSELNAGAVRTYTISPADFGIAEGSLEKIRGGDCEYNKTVVLNILNGEKGTPRDMVLMNAAAALRMVGKVASFKEGMQQAAEAIDSGRALTTLDNLRRMSNT